MDLSKIELLREAVVFCKAEFLWYSEILYSIYTEIMTFLSADDQTKIWLYVLTSVSMYIAFPKGSLRNIEY